MKKQLLFLSLLLLAVLHSKAQFNVYHPFPDSNAYWMNTGNHLCANGKDVRTYNIEYYLRGDTSINGFKYHIVAEEDWDQCNGLTPPWQYKATTACIREDSLKRVYLWLPLPHSSTYDTLLYDFSLKVGGLFTSYINAAGFDTVIGIDSILIGTSYRKQFLVKYMSWSGPYSIDSIVEGIGSWNGLLGPIGPYEFGDLNLICFKHNQDSVGTCNYVYTGTNAVNKHLVQFTIFPNPANTSVNISYQLANSEQSALLKLYNSIGQLIRSRSVSPSKNEIQEDVSSLPNGIYYYTFSVEGLVTATNKMVIIK